MILSNEQLKAVDNLKNGSILCGGVGSGKSRAALYYYILKVCEGGLNINGIGSWSLMRSPRNLYIITTAKKRDSLDWHVEAAGFGLPNVYGIEMIVDSWNNIKKYVKISGAFFIFDEQRVVGSGAWVKAFLDITRKNEWILLSATPGDQWADYIPVFVANRFFKNKTEFCREHCVYARFAKYPKIEKYIGVHKLERLRDSILVPMGDNRITTRHEIYVNVSYDRELYRSIFRDRWDVFANEPIAETGKLVYLLRKVVNAHESRIEKTLEILKRCKRAIIFYSFNYELEYLCNALESISWPFSEWNGHKHEDLPKSDLWAYLVQYTAGCEGWNCTSCDTIIFFSQQYSYKVLEQACGRIDRLNTPYRDLYYYHLKSNAPIDMAIFRKLKHKESFNERAFLRRLKNVKFTEN